MTILLNLTEEMVDVMRESLQYSKLNIQRGQDTPASVRTSKLELIDSILRELPRVAARIDD